MADFILQKQLMFGLYTLYSNGQVYSHDRLVRVKNGYRIIKGKFLKHRKDSHGYSYIGLTDKFGKINNHRIHRLLMLNFNYNKDHNNLVVNHLDGIKHNNDLKNLEWCTKSENTKHAFENGLINFGRTYKDYVSALIILRESGWSNAKIGRAFGKSPDTIATCFRTQNINASKKGRFGGKL